jgi:hypothetical protein
MPIAADHVRLAASMGSDAKRVAARRAVALEFVKQQLFEGAGEPWETVRRVLQCIDYLQPIASGPLPSAPRQLFALPGGSFLGGGFFAETAPAELNEPIAWVIAPEAHYLKFFAPYLDDPAVASAGRAGDARFFIPAARNGACIVARRA